MGSGDWGLGNREWEVGTKLDPQLLGKSPGRAGARGWRKFLGLSAGGDERKNLKTRVQKMPDHLMS